MKTSPPSIEIDCPEEVDVPLDPLGQVRVFVDRGEIGRGGMGSVRRMWDPRILRTTAIKSIDPATVRTGLVPRFIEEAQITGQLEHPNIVPVHEFGSDAEGHLYLSLKLVDGDTYWRRIRDLGEDRLRPKELGDLVQILIKVCEAVGYAHNRGVVHRDLKPSNLMLGNFGQVYVLDWGIAKVVESQDGEAVVVSRSPQDCLDHEDSLIGTPSWMAPEQAMGDHAAIDARTDVFALGGLIYFTLTGTAPYGVKGDVVQVIRRAQTCRFTRPSEIEGLPLFPIQLERIAMKCMAVHPDDRYPSMREVKADLEAFVRGSWSFPTRKFRRGDFVVKEGDPGNEAFVVQWGQLQVQKGRLGRVVRELVAGECFGEMAVFTNAPRSASVVAKTDVELLVVTRVALQDGLGLNSWMGSFVTALARRFQEVERELQVVREQTTSDD
ncbi:MAG: cyclic nucleotide-binding domain-containing protein [Rhodobacterales bacterium]|nr:cyclic nucleotide-binding domain-containing protein [Rhodobacterales bacterium]